MVGDLSGDESLLVYLQSDDETDLYSRFEAQSLARC